MSSIGLVFNQARVASPDGITSCCSRRSLALREIEVRLIAVSKSNLSLECILKGELVGIEFAKMLNLSNQFTTNFIRVGVFLAFRGGKRGSLNLVI